MINRKCALLVGVTNILLFSGCHENEDPRIPHINQDVRSGLDDRAKAEDRASSNEVKSVDEQKDLEKAIDNSNPLNSVLQNFFEAIIKGNLESVANLVEQEGVDINNVDPNDKVGKKTALMVAATNNKVAITDYLVAKGANIDKKNAAGHTVLDLLSDSDDLQVIIKRIILKEQINESNLAIMLFKGAREAGADPAKLDLMIFALNRGVNINVIPENESMTALAAAAGLNFVAVEALLARGADINANLTGQTPLISAIYAKRIEMVRYLLENGADKMIKYGGKTPLQHAERTRVPEIITLLKD